jgi:hypothetical protein
MEEIKQKLVRGMSSEEYHGIQNIYSSSQLKDLLDDEEIFYRKYIAKTEEKQSIPAFDIGSYFHTAILEPHKLKDDTAVFEGIRRGEKWEKFKEENKNRAIITATEVNTAEVLIHAVKNSPIAMNRIKRCEAEVSAFIDLVVFEGEIYCGNYRLAKYGWENSEKQVKKKGTKIRVKARADALAEDFILDLKSTSGNAKSQFSMMRKVSEYSYDLSAALYLDIFSMATERTITDFVWTFASKDMGNSKSYLATQENIQIGRQKWKKAIVKLANCIETNWQFEDSLGMMPPNSWEKDILQTKGEDLL